MVFGTRRRCVVVDKTVLDEKFIKNFTRFDRPNNFQAEMHVLNLRDEGEVKIQGPSAIVVRIARAGVRNCRTMWLVGKESRDSSGRESRQEIDERNRRHNDSTPVPCVTGFLKMEI